MQRLDSKYSIELVNPDGDLLADLSGRAVGRHLTKSRNEAEEIEWSIDLNEFERYAALTKQDPKNIIIVDQTEVRIKRGQVYLAGGQINYIEGSVDSARQALNIKGSGFLNLFKDRYTDTERIFTGIQATTIAWTLIDESQSLTNGDFGVTQGNVATVGTHDRTYRDTNIKDALQNLTKVQVNPFDFEFSYDKIFNTYAALGSQRPEIIFEYPGNIKSFSVPLDGTGIANQVIAKGGGFGDEAQTQSVADDLGSQSIYKLRQRIITPNGVIEQDTLDQHAEAELAGWAFPFEIPQIVVDGNVAPFITDYNIGDYVRVRINDFNWFSHIDRLYRIEKYELDIDDEDNETVKLYLSA